MKVKTLFLIAFAILMTRPLFSQEEGIIIYTDFEPDTIITPVKYKHEGGEPIDVNKDAQWDICFAKHFISVGYCLLDMYSPTPRAWEFCRKKYDNIPNHTNWNDDMNITPSTVGFPPNTIVNIGLRHWIEDVGYCYGWMRFSYNQFSDCGFNLTIYDMAYCTIPDYPLKFGQTDFVDIEENEYATSDAILFPNPASDFVKLAVSRQPSVVRVYNTLGMLVEEIEMNSEEIEINTASYNNGVYFVRVDDGSSVTVNRVVISK